MINKMDNFTLGIIKPDATKANHIGEIIAMIEAEGFVIRGMALTQLAPAQAAEFYDMHKEKPFFNDLCAFMSSDVVVVMLLEKENAVADFRKLIGATNPKEAAPGTIRHKFGSSIDENAVHGSDSMESAALEAAFFFQRHPSGGCCKEEGGSCEEPCEGDCDCGS